MLPDLQWDAETIHNTIYDIAENQHLPTKIAFQTFYQILLGQEKGPRLGYFLSSLDKQFVMARIKEAIK